MQVPKKPSFSYSDAANPAATIAQRFQSKHQYTDYRVAKLFKGIKNSYRIEKIREYNYDKLNSTRSHWKTYRDVDVFQILTVMQELIRRMTGPNYKLVQKTIKMTL